MTSPAGSPNGRLRVGFVPGVTLTKWRTIWRDRFPRSPLDVVEVPVAAQRAALERGEVDMCFVRLPIESDGLHLIHLYDEVPVVWVSKEHPLAAYEEVATADLAGENVLTEATPEAIDQVVMEIGVLRVPASIARSGSRRDLVYRRVVDAPPSPVALAWLVDATNPLIQEFVGVVRGRTANSSRTEQERGRKASSAQTHQGHVRKRQQGGSKRS